MHHTQASDQGIHLYRESLKIEMENQLKPTVNGVTSKPMNVKRDCEDDDSIPAEMLRQRQEAMGLRREIIEHDLLKIHIFTQTTKTSV